MKELKRSEAIALLRRKCAALVDDDQSLCHVASRLKILCGGFSQWKFHELKDRYDWIVKKRPGITRDELEDLANRWQLARQFVNEEGLSCDVQVGERHHQICHGWEEHSDEDLAACVLEVTGERVKIAPDPSPAETPQG